MPFGKLGASPPHLRFFFDGDTGGTVAPGVTPETPPAPAAAPVAQVAPVQPAPTAPAAPAPEAPPAPPVPSIPAAVEAEIRELREKVNAQAVETLQLRYANEHGITKEERVLLTATSEDAIKAQIAAIVAHRAPGTASARDAGITGGGKPPENKPNNLTSAILAHYSN